MHLPPNSLPHPQFPDYFVTPEGEIWSTMRKTPRKLRTFGLKHQNDYQRVGGKFGVRENGTKIPYYLVHRLVAETFLPNPHNLTVVNHINGDKTDNRVSNLEWVTQSVNCKKSWEKNSRRRVYCDKLYEILHVSSGATFLTDNLTLTAEDFGMTYVQLKTTKDIRRTYKFPIMITGVVDQPLQV